MADIQQQLSALLGREVRRIRKANDTPARDRPQLMYTEEDRCVFQEAWEMTTAHRDDLAGRPGNPQAAPAVEDRPSVLDMLRTVRE